MEQDTNLEQEPPMSTAERYSFILEYVGYMDEPSAAKYFAALVPDYNSDVDGKDFEEYYRMIEIMYSLPSWEYSGGRDAPLLAEAQKAAESARKFGVGLGKLEAYLE